MEQQRYLCQKYRIMLDTDALCGIIDDTADGIDVSIPLLDTDTPRILLTGQHIDTSGGGT